MNVDASGKDLSQHFRRARSWLVTVAAVGVGCAVAEPNQLGPDELRGDGGVVAGGGAAGLPGAGTPGVGNPNGGPPPPNCGNGVIDPGEACDGPTLNGATCASATLNAAPLGSIRCSTVCQIDASGCTGSGVPGGGNPGTGGAMGVAPGPAGTGSTPPGGGGGAGGVSNGSGGTDNPPAGGSPSGAQTPAKLPAATTCPPFTNGGTVQIARANGSMMPVVIYVDPNAKSKPAPGGPIILYYHATLSSPAEVHQGFGDQNIAAVTGMGGVVAAFTTTACTGCAGTDDGYWFVEDNVVQDTVVACAIQQANIDTRHIHALGWSAGALHTDTVALLRSNYMASVISYSGGYGPWPGTMTPQDPSNHVASIQTYGDSTDVVVISFPTQSKQWYTTLQPQGFYTMMCNHPGGHEIDPGVAPKSLQFFMDHPYKVSPEPYASAVPSGYPAYCKNAP